MKKYYYVYRVGRQKRPAVKHFLLADAVKEAERLAAQHPGEAFEILEAIAITQATAVQTIWMEGIGFHTPNEY
jgi:hypothetical protein